MEDRFGLFLKATSGIIGGFFSWMVGGLGMAFTVLLALMVLDFITGLMVGYVNKELKSSSGVEGLIKKTYIVILIGCVYWFSLRYPRITYRDHRGRYRCGIHRD